MNKQSQGLLEYDGWRLANLTFVLSRFTLIVTMLTMRWGNRQVISIVSSGTVDMLFEKYCTLPPWDILHNSVTISMTTYRFF